MKMSWFHYIRCSMTKRTQEEFDQKRWREVPTINNLLRLIFKRLRRPIVHVIIWKKRHMVTTMENNKISRRIRYDRHLQCEQYPLIAQIALTVLWTNKTIDATNNKRKSICKKSFAHRNRNYLLQIQYSCP